MIKKYFIYILLFLVGILVASCKKEEKQSIKGREYITESGFSNETTISVKETKVIETTTEVFDIKKHPEMWSMTDKETYIFILNDVLDNGYGQKYIDKLPLSDRFRENRHNGIFDYIEQVNRPEDWERYLSASASDEEFHQHLVWICTGSWTMERETLLQYTLDDKNRLDSIRVIKSEITKDIVAESIANRPKSYDDLERYEEIIPILVSPVWSIVNDFHVATDKSLTEFENYYKTYEGCTENFLEKYDCWKGIINIPVFNVSFDEISKNGGFKSYFLQNYEETNMCDVRCMDYNSNELLTDLSRKCVGVCISYYNNITEESYEKNYKVYFEVDDRNFLDSITKVEEVLEDGTVVEVENNFGK